MNTPNSIDISNVGLDLQKIAEQIYRNGVMLYLNAFIGEKWRELPENDNWEEKFTEVLMKEADLIARQVNSDHITENADSVGEHFNELKTACFHKDGPNIEVAIFHLGRIGYHGSLVMSAREVARSKIEQSRNLLKKRTDPVHARRRAIQSLWASGKFSSRDRCADEEWQALGFPSFRAARESLNGTPDPTTTQERTPDDSVT